MPWRETCSMEERMRFVLACEAGAESFSAVCRGTGCAGGSVTSACGDTGRLGVQGLVNRSRAPSSHPDATPETQRPVYSLPFGDIGCGGRI